MILFIDKFPNTCLHESLEYKIHSCQIKRQKKTEKQKQQQHQQQKQQQQKQRQQRQQQRQQQQHKNMKNTHTFVRTTKNIYRS